MLNEALSVLVRNGEADTSASSAKPAKAAATYVKPHAATGSDAVVELREAIKAKLVYVLGKTPEAARERRSRLSTAPDPDPLLRTLMRLRHDLVLLRRAITEADADVLRIHLAGAWETAANAAAARLRDLAEALAAGRRPTGDEAALAAAIVGYRDAIDGMRRRQVTRTLPTDGVGRIFWLAFSLEQLRRNLDDLAARANDFATPEA